jgi:hypothetical protein
MHKPSSIKAISDMRGTSFEQPTDSKGCPEHIPKIPVGTDFPVWIRSQLCPEVVQTLSVQAGLCLARFGTLSNICPESVLTSPALVRALSDRRIQLGPGSDKGFLIVEEGVKWRPMCLSNAGGVLRFTGMKQRTMVVGQGAQERAVYTLWGESEIEAGGAIAEKRLLEREVKHRGSRGKEGILWGRRFSE